MHVAPSDFVALTRGGALCDAKDRLGAAEFELAMREQIRLYAQAEIGFLLLLFIYISYLQLERRLSFTQSCSSNVNSWYNDYTLYSPPTAFPQYYPVCDLVEAAGPACQHGSAQVKISCTFAIHMR
jgi:hypothetical protein